jgi:hypothetical protein
VKFSEAFPWVGAPPEGQTSGSPETDSDNYDDLGNITRKSDFAWTYQYACLFGLRPLGSLPDAA